MYTLYHLVALTILINSFAHRITLRPAATTVSKESVIIDRVFEMEDVFLRGLEVIDNSVCKIWEWTRHDRQLLKCLAGGVLCFYSGSFYNTILLAQAIRISGAHKILHNIEDLGANFRKVRTVMADVEPDMKRAKGEIIALVEGMEHLAVEISKVAHTVLFFLRSDVASTISTLTFAFYILHFIHRPRQILIYSQK